MGLRDPHADILTKLFSTDRIRMILQTTPTFRWSPSFPRSECINDRYEDHGFYCMKQNTLAAQELILLPLFSLFGQRTVACLTTRCYY